MSTRTLQRRFTDAGITFSHNWSKKPGRELAHHYLRQSTVE